MVSIAIDNRLIMGINQKFQKTNSKKQV